MASLTWERQSDLSKHGYKLYYWSYGDMCSLSIELGVEQMCYLNERKMQFRIFQCFPGNDINENRWLVIRKARRKIEGGVTIIRSP